MANKIHPLQEQIYRLFLENNRNLPSFREISKVIGVSSTNTVAYHINKLKAAGYLDTNEKNAVVELNLKNILNFDSKSGVYVLIKNKNPFYIGESENIKNHLVNIISSAEKNLVGEIKNNAEKISIAYYLIDDIEERKNLKNYLENFYKEKGFNLFV